jgi:hypothetical protein
MSESKVTFGMSGSVVFDMEMDGGPLPRGVRSPARRLDASPVVIICTEQDARAMAAWLSKRSHESAEYGAVVKLIETTLRLPR